MLISEAYREQQKYLHANTTYGVASGHFAPQVSKMIEKHQVDEVLDYGAGSRLTLINTIRAHDLCRRPFKYTPYEPAVDEYSAIPEPTEMVVCFDVLEHIEPECLDDVLDDLKRCTLRLGIFTVSTGPAEKTLPDGRNAHLIQEPASWWLPKLMDRFTLQTFQLHQGWFQVLVTPLRL
jgi:hypothetical protein